MRKIVVLAAVAAILGLAGCAGTTGQATVAPPAAARSTEPPLAAALGFVQNPKLGPIVVDGEGRTLYRFDEDSADPPRSSCVGGCATAWPPVPAIDAQAVTSLDPALIGSLTRDDGSKQLTIAGWPVYRFAKDTQRGEANGHGLNGTWSTIAPTGGKAGGAEQARAPLSVVQDPVLGPIVVDGQGRTVYRNDCDGTRPPRSNCKGECAAAWPAVPAVDPALVRGIDPKLVGVLTRPDGTKQATLAGRPLYRFVNDKKPGDTNGNGAAGDFFAITPTGAKANNGKLG